MIFAARCRIPIVTGATVKTSLSLSNMHCQPDRSFMLFRIRQPRPIVTPRSSQHSS
jgi:hypothetical protein